MNSTDIRIIFSFKYKLGNNAAKAALNINQAFGENTVNYSKIGALAILGIFWTSSPIFYFFL